MLGCDSAPHSAHTLIAMECSPSASASGCSGGNGTSSIAPAQSSSSDATLRRLEVRHAPGLRQTLNDRPGVVTTRLSSPSHAQGPARVAPAAAALPPPAPATVRRVFVKVGACPLYMEIPGDCVALRRRPLLHLLHKLPHFQPHFEGTGSDFATVGIVQGPLDGGVPTASDEVPPGVLEVDNDIITIGAASADVRTGARLYIRVTPAPREYLCVGAPGPLSRLLLLRHRRCCTCVSHGGARWSPVSPHAFLPRSTPDDRPL